MHSNMQLKVTAGTLVCKQNQLCAQCWHKRCMLGAHLFGSAMRQVENYARHILTCKRHISAAPAIVHVRYAALSGLAVSMHIIQQEH